MRAVLKTNPAHGCGVTCSLDKAQLLWVLVILNKEDKIREVVSVHLTCVKYIKKNGHWLASCIRVCLLSLCLPVGYFLKSGMKYLSAVYLLCRKCCL